MNMNLMMAGRVAASYEWRTAKGEKAESAPGKWPMGDESVTVYSLSIVTGWMLA
jgi:hypothetical protein